MTTLSQAAKMMSSKGASKGGKARARVLSPERRSEIARIAVQARIEKYRQKRRKQDACLIDTK